MAAHSSTIFKVRANSQFISASDNVLSFRKGQAFYVLSTNQQDGYYFVSTHYATPFARNAVCGLVPMNCFEIIDLHAKIAAPQPRRASNADALQAEQQARQKNSMDPNDFASARSIRRHPVFRRVSQEAIVDISVMPFDVEQGKNPAKEYIYGIRITRKSLTHTVFRTWQDFKFLHATLMQSFKNTLPILPAAVNTHDQTQNTHTLYTKRKEQHSEISMYISNLAASLPTLGECPVFVYFFEPHFPVELEQIEEHESVRRDSKMDETESFDSKKQQKQTGFMSHLRSKSFAFLRS